MLSDNHLVSRVEVETVPKLAPDLEPVPSPDHVAEYGTCQLGGSYPDLMSWDSPSSDGTSVWPGPCPVVMPELPPVTAQLSCICNHEFSSYSSWLGS